MKPQKPTVGDLVRIYETRLTEEEIKQGNAERWLNKIGIVYECVGVCCRVYWSANDTTLTERGILEVLT